MLSAAEVKLDTSSSQIKGECTSFAPKSELSRRDRIISEKFEKGDVQNADGSHRHLEPIKHYSRSAAGNTQCAEEILTPETIHRCLTYICEVLLQRLQKRGGEGDVDFKMEFFTFLDNRLRSLGKDYESQSVFGKEHMCDMGTMFRIYVMRIFECTRTVEECSQFCMFQKLNNERMDAIQGVLLQYMYNPENTEFFTEIFGLFLLRCLGHDAELDARHWWSDILATRRQMLFKLSTSPLYATLAWDALYTPILAIHFLETGQWLAYCALMKEPSTSILHVTLMACPLSYIRVRALQEMCDGKAIGGRKKRYVGALSRDYLAEALLFTDSSDLREFGHLLNLAEGSAENAILCGSENYRGLSFSKNAKMQLLRPLPPSLMGDESRRNAEYSLSFMSGFAVRNGKSGHRDIKLRCSEDLQQIIRTYGMRCENTAMSIASTIENAKMQRQHSSQSSQSNDSFHMQVDSICGGENVSSPNLMMSPVEGNLSSLEYSTSPVVPPKCQPTIAIDEFFRRPRKRPIPIPQSESENPFQCQTCIVQNWVAAGNGRPPRWTVDVFDQFFRWATSVTRPEMFISLRWFIIAPSAGMFPFDELPHALSYVQTYRELQEGRFMEIHVDEYKANVSYTDPTGCVVFSVFHRFHNMTDLQEKIRTVQQWKQAKGLGLIQIIILVTPDDEWAHVLSHLENLSQSDALSGLFLYSFQDDSPMSSESFNVIMKALLFEALVNGAMVRNVNGRFISEGRTRDAFN
ncbi:80 kDa MCM3-associated protein [Perkinsela sp. CCAP 1560/4]|nr:80 kDa MCM3-associated protein [Perkinsela sp. CCAP 1560/4]|eukprot:KNH09444.1 80 kDa MCM3-associated protein [Perkinsela sp. CCAP 1560/4]